MLIGGTVDNKPLFLEYYHSDTPVAHSVRFDTDMTPKFLNAIDSDNALMVLSDTFGPGTEDYVFRLKAAIGELNVFHFGEVIDSLIRVSGSVAHFQFLISNGIRILSMNTDNGSLESYTEFTSPLISSPESITGQKWNLNGYGLILDN